VLSRAVGPDFGVSKAADVTIVRIPQSIRGPADPPGANIDFFRFSVLVDSVNIVTQDFLTQRAANPAFQCVFVFSTGGTAGANIPPVVGDEEFDLFAAMEQLSRAGCVIVAACGQEAEEPRIDGVSVRHSIFFLSY